MPTHRAVIAQPAAAGAAVGPLTPPVQPVNGLQLQRLTQALRGLSAEQLTWASGYLAGLAAAWPALGVAAELAPAAVRITILYGSQTGNARSVAEALGRQAAARHLAHRVVSTADFRPRDLAKEQLVLLVISTQGEGDPPESALALHRFLHGHAAPRLTGLRYGVFGLGDSSYVYFCKTARDFDERLAELGARRIVDRVDADLDFRPVSEGWFPAALDRVASELPDAGQPRDAQVVPLHPVPAVRHDQDLPYRARVLDNRPLTTRDAVAEVRHLVLGLDPHAISYTPGDSLGVWFRNAPALVEGVLAATGLDQDAPVDIGGDGLTLVEALRARLELTRLHPTVVTAWAKIAGDAGLAALVQDRDALRTFAQHRQVIDLVTEFPGRPDAAALAALLQPLKPRLYSIASAQTEFEDEVHLTVSVLRYQHQGQERLGGASGFLAERLAEGDPLDCYVAENPSFRLPEDGETPIILVGAGTGIAPFRAFLQERAAQGDRGRNWLVFGNRHFQRDFLYQADWLRLRKAGLLHRFSPAFSRDTVKRVYVQDRLRAE
ncbi:MAG TPA: flavodoxin domain-containing protein, partial [Lamprocystis sp. (in: g-proteobacteria)]|nr:flavodoxin domain-containing protein [Lamprocystis sp. (in: g-proteobacteria)]